MENESTNNVQTTGTAPQGQEKTFTQAEVNSMIQQRLERERKKYPSDDELSEFRTWKGSQQTEQERWNTLTSEKNMAQSQLEAVRAELEQYQRERLLISKGVPTDDVDYYAFKIGKLVSDGKTFEQAADEFLSGETMKNVRIDLSAKLGTNAAPTGNDAMNALIRGARK